MDIKYLFKFYYKNSAAKKSEITQDLIFYIIFTLNEIQISDTKTEEAPHTARNTRKGRGEPEEENETTEEIYNYIFEEK